LNNNKLHKSSAIFLATVLVAGIIALSSPSFMVGAQAVPQYGMEREYGSYEQPEYGSYEQPEYGSYEQPEYGSYEQPDSYEQPEYGMDSYEKPSYRNDYYEQPEYPSYKPDYKPEYPSYEKDNRDKSKKDSVSINKVKCINTNLNINGNNTGNVGIGNKGQGYLGTYSSADGRNGGDDGYSKQGKGFECIINNNNNNTNIAAGGGGNVPEPEPEPNCTDAIACFANLNPTQLGDLKDELGLAVDAPDEALCNILDDFTGAELRFEITEPVVGVTDAVATVIINCLIDAGFTNLIEE
jgi:hypothetical protein